MNIKAVLTENEMVQMDCELYKIHEHVFPLYIASVTIDRFSLLMCKSYRIMTHYCDVDLKL